MSVEDALSHYLSVGAKSSKDPNILFSTSWYEEQNPDVAALGLNPLIHYVLHGGLEGRDPHPLFLTAACAPNLTTDAGLTPLGRFISEGSDRRLSPGPLFDIDLFESQVGYRAPTLIHLSNYLYGEESWRDPNPLFNPHFYQAAYPEVKDQRLHPLQDYIFGGWRTRQPHPLFDALGYMDRHPELKKGRLDPVSHYRLNGRHDQVDPHPLFNVAYYCANVDVGDDELPLENFIRHGCQPNRNPNPLFDCAWYIKNVPNAIKLGRDCLTHYVVEGEDQGARPHPLFDPKWYADQYPEVNLVHPGPRNGKILRHYIEAGEALGLNPNLYFDGAFYKRQIFGEEREKCQPLQHYLAEGPAGNYDPNPFFSNSFYAQTQDLRAQTPLEHFLEAGEAASARPHPLWDEELYQRSNPDVRRAVRTEKLKSGYRHFVTMGAREIASRQETSRRLSFRLHGYTFDFDEAAYREDNADVAVFVNRGTFASGLEHFFKRGFEEAQTGLRAVYASTRWTKIKRIYNGDASRSGRHICFFAHFDVDGFIDQHVLTYLRVLRDLGFDIVFITAIEDQKKLLPVEAFALNIIIKNEAGRDFHSWRVAFENMPAEQLSEYDQLVLANDSVYFPVNDPADLMKSQEIGRFDYWGVTDSRDWSDGQYHVQSYFLGFSRAARTVLLPRLMELVRSMPVLTKRGQIIEFEIGFTTAAMEEALSVGVMCPIDDIREDVIKDPRFSKWRDKLQFGIDGVNPTLHLWSLLLIYYSCPILKVQLLRDNPTQERDVYQWAQLVSRNGVSARSIEAHQKRLKGEGGNDHGPPRGSAPSLVVQSDLVAVREVVEGRGLGRGKRLVLLAHYDPDDLLDPHVAFTIRSLTDANCDVVIITSSAKPQTISAMREVASKVIIKTGGGRDFGSWYVAGAALKSRLTDYDSVVWLNDSIYFPLFDPNKMFLQMEGRSYEFWGVVDSFNIRWHVMSWFWSFDKKIVSDGFLDWFAQEYNPSYTKWSQIKNYEMRIPSLLRSKGYQVGAYVGAERLFSFLKDDRPDHERFAGARDFTMTHDFWDIIIERFKCPALKVELLRDNPLGLDLSSVYSLIGSVTDYDPDLIRNHVWRIKVGHVPAFESVLNEV